MITVNRVRAFFAIFFGALLLFLLWAVTDQASDIRQAAQSVHWPRVSGTIIASAVGACGKHNAYFVAEVHYTYTVQGRQFESGRIAFGPPGCGIRRGPAQSIVRQYPIGQTVTVYYDAEQPEQAALQSDVVTDMWVGLGALSVALLFIGALLWWGLVRIGKFIPALSNGSKAPF